MIKLKPLDQQVIVITGASSGIGRVTARLAASRGAAVFLVARNEDALREVVGEIDAAGGRAAYAVADVGIAADVDAAATQAIDRFGRIDAWVSNAGTAIYGKIVDTPLAEHEHLFRTNYFGTLHSLLAAHRQLKGSGGAIIVVGSIASDLPSPILSAYAASKHAVKGLVESLRMEFRIDRLPISLTLIKPAGIDTPIAQHAANHVDGEALIPQPVYDPTIVAEAILDAAVHPRRDVTVGGAGRLQVLLGTHFPALLDRLAGPLAAKMRNPDARKTAQTSLFTSRQPMRERSGVQAGRSTSVYTAAERHKLPIALSTIAVATGLTLLAARRLSRRDRSGDTAAAKPETIARGRKRGGRSRD